LRFNEQINVSEVLLIGQDGEKLGVMSVSSALSHAKTASLDLVEISPNTNPAVCRLMDYGKHLFDQKKQRTLQKKKQITFQVKEIKFRPTTDVGDYNIKLRKITQFLEQGHKVKISLRFRGREMQHRDLGMSLLNRVAHDLEAISVVEQQPKLEGRQVMMVLSAAKGLKATDKSSGDKGKIEEK
jgi:translation initiation factor IF-3